MPEPDWHVVVRKLHEVYTPQNADVWLHTPNLNLEGRKPIDLLYAGDYEPVLNAVRTLQYTSDLRLL